MNKATKRAARPNPALVSVEYSANNSGGNWWLEDKDWLALEKAGWEVQWGGSWFCNSKYELTKKTKYCPKKPCCKLTTGSHGQKDWNNCKGHRRFTKFSQMTKEDYWLGSAAKHARKSFTSLADGIREWESVTGNSASDEGCNCCGAPHSFSTKEEYASGDDVVRVLYGSSVPKSLREAAELLAKKAR